MTVIEPADATKRPVMLLGIRTSLWTVGCVLAGAVIGARFDLAIPGVAVGLLAGSALTAGLERKPTRSLRLQLIGTTLLAAWIVGITLFTKR